LGGGLALLSLADESDDAVEGAVLFGFGDADHEPTPAIEGPAGDACAGAFLDRLSFPGEVGFIDAALALGDDAVSRNQFAG